MAPVAITRSALERFVRNGEALAQLSGSDIAARTKTRMPANISIRPSPVYVKNDGERSPQSDETNA
jgi:hypothetical protein